MPAVLEKEKRDEQGSTWKTRSPHFLRSVDEIQPTVKIRSSTDEKWQPFEDPSAEARIRSHHRAMFAEGYIKQTGLRHSRFDEINPSEVADNARRYADILVPPVREARRQAARKKSEDQSP